MRADRDVYVMVRMAPEEKAEWQRAAATVGITLSDLIRIATREWIERKDVGHDDER